MKTYTQFSEDLQKSQTTSQGELQTEQTPKMEPNYYNKLIARSQLSRKREREAHAQREMEREASAQQVQKRREMRAIMSR